MNSPINPPASILLRMNNGIDHFATAIMLYPAADIAKVADLNAQAQQELRSGNLGIGFIGDPEFVIGGAIAAGIIGGLMGNMKAKKGMQLLQEAAVLQDKLLDLGVMFPVAQIHNIDRPFPAAWSGLHADGKPKIVYGRNPHVSGDGEAEYIALPRDLGIFEVEDEELWIRYSAITTYSLNGISVEPAPRATRAGAAPRVLDATPRVLR